MFPFFVLLDVSRKKSHITGKVPGGRLPRPFLNSRTRTINLILSFIAYSLNKDTLESFILLFFHHKRQFVYHISVEGSKALSWSLLNWYYLCSPLRYSRLNSWWNDDGYDSCPPPPPPNDIDLGVGLSLKLSHVRLYICNNHIFTTCLVIWYGMVLFRCPTRWREGKIFSVTHKTTVIVTYNASFPADSTLVTLGLNAFIFEVHFAEVDGSDVNIESRCRNGPLQCLVL